MDERIKGVTSDLAKVADDATATFGSLSAEQLNWKPAEKSWSVAQCLEHLIITNSLEFPAVKKALTANYQNPFCGKIPFLPSIFGKVMIYLMRPESTRKFKAPKTFQPSKSEISEHIVQDLIAHQQEVLELFKQSKNLDLHKTKIVSPVSALITYSLADAFTILMVHEQRHFGQAKRVTEAEGFPRSELHAVAGR